jgi:hypothetical protein
MYLELWVPDRISTFLAVSSTLNESCHIHKARTESVEMNEGDISTGISVQVTAV